MSTNLSRPNTKSNPGERGQPASSFWLMLGLSLLSLVAFLYPILLPWLARPTPGVGGPALIAAPLILALVAGCCLMVTVMHVTETSASGGSAAKLAALLGAIVAIDATIRLVPSFGGASPIFFMIILTGSVFGPRLGFLAGSLTLLVSAFLTGGVGPWLPFQMMGAGWVGLGAGWIPRPDSVPVRIALIALYGVISGVVYGALLSLYGWPFVAPGVQETSSLYWSPDLSVSETISRYASYYLVTSFSHDVMRSIGNAVLIVALGAPLLVTLDRALRRLDWQISGRPAVTQPEPTQDALSSR